jgi:uncharacterized protein YdhG (YjbR/CyaY superfamily)
LQSNAVSVDDYLDELPADRRAEVSVLRDLIRDAAPNAVEGMRYGMPSYELGKQLCALAAQKQYLSLYVMDLKLLEEIRPRLGKLDCGKGCIRIRHFDDAPLDVLRELVSRAASRREAQVTRAPCDGR